MLCPPQAYIAHDSQIIMNHFINNGFRGLSGMKRPLPCAYLTPPHCGLCSAPHTEAAHWMQRGITQIHTHTRTYTHIHCSTTGRRKEKKKKTHMDDPLTKWLHLHSNINNTTGTVSAKNKYTSIFKPSYSLFLKVVLGLLSAEFYRRNVHFSQPIFSAIVRSEGSDCSYGM